MQIKNLEYQTLQGNIMYIRCLYYLRHLIKSVFFLLIKWSVWIRPIRTAATLPPEILEVNSSDDLPAFPIFLLTFPSAEIHKHFQNPELK